MSSKGRGRGRPPLATRLPAKRDEGMGQTANDEKGEGLAAEPLEWTCGLCQKVFISFGGYQYHTKNVCRPRRQSQPAKKKAALVEVVETSSSGSGDEESDGTTEEQRQRREFFVQELRSNKRERRPVERLGFMSSESLIGPSGKGRGKRYRDGDEGSEGSGSESGENSDEGNSGEEDDTHGSTDRGRDCASSDSDDGLGDEAGVDTRVSLVFNEREPSMEELAASRERWAAEATANISSSSSQQSSSSVCIEVNLEDLDIGPSTLLCDHLDTARGPSPEDSPAGDALLALLRGGLRISDSGDQRSGPVDVPGLRASRHSSDPGLFLNTSGAVLFVALSPSSTADQGGDTYLAVGSASIGFAAQGEAGAPPRALLVGDSSPVRIGERLRHPNLLQVWTLHCGGSEGASLAYMVAVDRGPLWDGQWRGGGGSGLLAGVLAVTCGDGTVVVLALPTASPAHPGVFSAAAVPVLREAGVCKAVVSLQGPMVTALAWRPSGDHLLCGAGDAAIYLCDVSGALRGCGGALVDTFKSRFADASPQLPGLHRAVTGVCCSPHSSTQFLSVNNDCAAYLWDISQPEPLLRISASQELCLGWLSACAWDPCGVGVYVGSSEVGLVAHCSSSEAVSPLISPHKPLLAHAFKYTAVAQLRAVQQGGQTLLLSCATDGSLRMCTPGSASRFEQLLRVTAVEEEEIAGDSSVAGPRHTAIAASCRVEAPSGTDTFAPALPRSARLALHTVDALLLGDSAQTVLVACGAACGLVRICRIGGEPAEEK